MQIPSNAQGGADVAVLEEIDEKQQHCSELKQCYQIGLGLRVFFCEGASLHSLSGSLEISPSSLAQIPKCCNLLCVQSVQRGRGSTAAAVWGKAPPGTAAPGPALLPPASATPALPGTPAATFTAPESDTGKISFHSRLRLHHQTHTHRIWGTLRTGAEMKGQP